MHCKNLAVRGEAPLRLRLRPGVRSAPADDDPAAREAAPALRETAHPPVTVTRISSKQEKAFMFGNNCSAGNLRAIHPARPWPTPIRLAKSVFAGAMLALMVVQGALPGVVQIWSGYFARTAPGWALLSRGIANKPKTQPYVAFGLPHLLRS